MSPDTRFVLLLVLFLGVLLLCTKPLGSYIADVMEGRPRRSSTSRLRTWIWRRSPSWPRKPSSARPEGGEDLRAPGRAGRIYTAY